MTGDPERTIIDSARYLRGVRPIDPEELAGYVGDPYTAAKVATILRREATTIGLVERDDGCFIAPSTEPIAVPFDGVVALPLSVEQRVESSFEAAFGTNWARGESGDALRAAIRRFKAAYLAGEPVCYDRTTAMGYAIYHLPSTYAEIQYVVAEVVAEELLSGSIRVLDVGAGVGGQALGVLEFLPNDVLVEYTAIEASDDAADLFESYLADPGPNVHLDIQRSRIETADLEGPYDLIIGANVVNEIDEAVATIERLRTELDPAGTLVLIEPADRRTSRGLRRIERGVCRRRDLSVFSPTLRLWPDHEPADDCWSFDIKPDLDVPSFQRILDEAPRSTADGRPPATGEFVNVDVQYSYSILRTDGKRRIDFSPTKRRYRPLAAAEEQITQRVTVAVVKLSHPLTDDGNDLFVIGDGSQSERWFAVRSAETRLNRWLLEAEYADVLLIENGLVLWNDDEAAINLVVDERTVVDRITPAGHDPA